MSSISPVNQPAAWTKLTARPSHFRKTLLVMLAGIGLFPAVLASAQTAASFTEDFSGPTLNSALQDTGGTYSLGSGAANTTGNRTYISTVATDFLNSDFSAMLTYTVQDGGLVFFGVGSGQPDPNFYDEPLDAIYMRSDPASFNSGAVHVSVNNNSSVNEGAAFGFPGDGTSRALITKTGDTITFAVDPNPAAEPSFQPMASPLAWRAPCPFWMTPTAGYLSVLTADQSLIRWRSTLPRCRNLPRWPCLPSAACSDGTCCGGGNDVA
jgi:hypothetical protein